jgi:hypothetical protein
MNTVVTAESLIIPIKPKDLVAAKMAAYAKKLNTLARPFFKPY